MVPDLPTIYAGFVASAGARRRSTRGLIALLAELAWGRMRITLKRERRLTFAFALKQLPPGTCLVARESRNRGWYVDSADQAAGQLAQQGRQPSDQTP